MITQTARDLYAAEIERQGPAYQNLANSIRAGFSNTWVEPALRAIDAALRFGAEQALDAPD